MQTGVSRNLVPKLSRASVLRPTRRNAAPMRTSVRIRNGLLTLPTGVDPRSATHNRKTFRVTRGDRAPQAVGRRHANATRVAGTVAVSRGASDGRVWVRPAVRVRACGRAPVANARRSRVRVTRALAPRRPGRVPHCATRKRCLRASGDCGYFVARSSKPSCDVKYNRNRCGGGRACGGAYWN